MDLRDMALDTIEEKLTEQSFVKNGYEGLIKAVKKSSSFGK